MFLTIWRAGNQHDTASDARTALGVYAVAGLEETDDGRPETTAHEWIGPLEPLAFKLPGDSAPPLL